MSYHELSVEERSTIQIGQMRGMGQREIAGLLGRSPSTISREWRRDRNPQGDTSATRRIALRAEYPSTPTLQLEMPD